MSLQQFKEAQLSYSWNQTTERSRLRSVRPV